MYDVDMDGRLNFSEYQEMFVNNSEVSFPMLNMEEFEMFVSEDEFSVSWIQLGLMTAFNEPHDMMMPVAFAARRVIGMADADLDGKVSEAEAMAAYDAGDAYAAFGGDAWTMQSVMDTLMQWHSIFSGGDVPPLTSPALHPTTPPLSSALSSSGSPPPLLLISSTRCDVECVEAQLLWRSLRSSTTLRWWSRA